MSILKQRECSPKLSEIQVLDDFPGVHWCHSPFIYSRMVGDPQSHMAEAFSAQRILRTVFGKMDAAKFLVQHSQVEARSSSKSWADDMLWLADESLPFQKQKKSRLLRHEPQYPKPLPGEWGLVLDMTTTFCWSQLVQFCTSVRWVENTGQKTIDKWWYNMVYITNW